MAARRRSLAERRRAIGHSQELLNEPIDKPALTPPAADTRSAAGISPPVGAGEVPHAALAADALESARFNRFVALSNADGATVEQLDADTMRMARLCVRLPAAQLHDDIRSLREVAFALLRGRQRPRLTSDLLMISSRLCGLSAHVCMDAGDYPSAATHARTAWGCAEAAGDSRTQAWVHSVESLIAFWGGDHRRAADRAQRGQALSASPDVVVRLAALEARALAVLGNSDGATLALRRARQAGEARCADGELPGVLGFPEAKQLTYAGTTYLAIGGTHVDDALRSSGAAIGQYSELAHEDRSTYDVLAAHLDLARGHLLLDDAEHAEHHLAPVWAAAPATLSASILSRLSSLAGELGHGPCRGASTARRLRERIADTVSAATRRSPAAPGPQP